MKKEYVAPTVETTAIADCVGIMAASGNTVKPKPKVENLVDDGGQDESEDIDPIDVFGTGTTNTTNN